MSVPWSFPEHVCPQREVEAGVAEMYAPPPHLTRPRPSSWCLGRPGPQLAQPGPVRKLSAGKLGSAGLRLAREMDGKKVAGGNWV